MKQSEEFTPARITAPSTRYTIDIDPTDGKQKIWKHERGIRYPVGEFYRLCDMEARDIAGMMENNN